MSDEVTDLIDEEVDSTGRASGVELEQDEGQDIDSPFDPTDVDIKTKNPSVDSLMKRLDYDEIDMNPDFQRKGGIWSNSLKSRLIESLMLNIPLPVFYVAADPDGRWIVVDGLQRLTTLNQFIRLKTFALEKLEFLTKFNNMKFDQLPRAMQRRIVESEPVFHIIQPGSPKAVTRTIFKRINTSGMPLSLQEIRHALYQGAATRFLKELAEGEAFMTATGGSIKDDRMADRECVLRYLAFRIKGVDEFRGSDVDGFLSDTMELLNDADPQALDEYRQGFERALWLAHAIFGDHAFRKQRRGRDGQRKPPVNKALFESWTLTLANLDEAQAAALVERRQLLNEAFVDLLESDTDFASAISANTGSVRSVRERFSKIADLIHTVLGEDV